MVSRNVNIIKHTKYIFCHDKPNRWQCLDATLRAAFPDIVRDYGAPAGARYTSVTATMAMVGPLTTTMQVDDFLGTIGQNLEDFARVVKLANDVEIDTIGIPLRLALRSPRYATAINSFLHVMFLLRQVPTQAIRPRPVHPSVYCLSFAVQSFNIDIVHLNRVYKLVYNSRIRKAYAKGDYAKVVAYNTKLDNSIRSIDNMTIPLMDYFTGLDDMVRNNDFLGWEPTTITAIVDVVRRLAGLPRLYPESLRVVVDVQDILSIPTLPQLTAANMVQNAVNNLALRGPAPRAVNPAPVHGALGISSDSDDDAPPQPAVVRPPPRRAVPGIFHNVVAIAPPQPTIPQRRFARRWWMDMPGQIETHLIASKLIPSLNFPLGTIVEH